MVKLESVATTTSETPVKSEAIALAPTVDTGQVGIPSLAALAALALHSEDIFTLYIVRDNDKTHLIYVQHRKIR